LLIWLLLMGRAVIHHPHQLPSVVDNVLGRAPNAGDAELAAAALIIVVRAVNLAPGVTATHLHAPAIRFCVLKRLFDFLFWMLCTTRFCR
jgi:hypothetical protein